MRDFHYVTSGGAGAGGLTGSLLGATTSNFIAVKAGSGAMIFAAETATAFTTGLVTALVAYTASIGSAMNAAVLAQIAGLPVVEAIAIHTGETKGSMIVIGGIPILREAVIAVGLVVLVIVGAYAYLLLKEKVDKSS